MAQRMKKTTPVEEIETSITNEDSKTKTKSSAKKKFQNDDMIECVSITAGKLFLIGRKTNDKYTWDGIGDVQEVAYADLISEVRTRNAIVFLPRIIIQNDDFLAQHEDILYLYGSLYTPDDILKILTLPAGQMYDYIKKMPVGAREALKGIAVERIERGELDSIQRIKIIDEFFGTELLLKMTQ